MADWKDERTDGESEAGIESGLAGLLRRATDAGTTRNLAGSVRERLGQRKRRRQRVAAGIAAAVLITAIGLTAVVNGPVRVERDGVAEIGSGREQTGTSDERSVLSDGPGVVPQEMNVGLETTGAPSEIRNTPSMIPKPEELLLSTTGTKLEAAEVRLRMEALITELGITSMMVTSRNGAFEYAMLAGMPEDHDELHAAVLRTRIREILQGHDFAKISVRAGRITEFSIASMPRRPRPHRGKVG